MTNKITIFLVLTFTLTLGRAQVNYVPNPSFEDTISCPSSSPIGQNFVKNWKSLDSVSPANCFFEYFNKCSSFGSTSVPANSRGTQKPRTGNAYVEMQLFCTDPICNSWKRTHMRVRLRSPLINSKVYCAKMYVNLIENCKYAIDGFAMNFDNGILDTVNPCSKVISFITPQVMNPSGNIISDTANWISVSGTFTATGNETYLTIGNFFSDAATSKTITNVTHPVNWSAYFIEDVSVIDYNLPTYAGPDQNINLGDSAFIGRPPEIGLECTWTIGTTTIGSGAGLWVKPLTTGTFSYVVTQNICGNIKTDTVNVNVSPSLISEHAMFSQSIGLFPQPANDIVKLTFRNYSDETVSIEILDTNGKTVYSKKEFVKNNSAVIPTDNLSDGIYYLKIKNSKDQFATKKLTVTH